MQDVFHSTGDQVEYLHSNGKISTVQIITAGMETRRARIANFYPGSVGWSTTALSIFVLRSEGHLGRSIVSTISLPGGQWRSILNV
jgi:hypothetical protein